MKFYQWYTEALGSIIGMIACVYSYIQGTLLLYSNLVGNYDTLNFTGVTASYILYPLCILTFIVSVIIYSMPNLQNNKLLGIDITKMNIFFKYTTVIIGILGCQIYFILPALLILFSDIILLFNHIRLHLHRHKKPIMEREVAIEAQLNPVLTNKDTIENECISTKTEIAIHLLNKNSNMEFIEDITGLSPEYLNKLKNEALNSPNKK